MNYDIQMTEDSDISLVGKDIRTTESVKQAIMIRLRWFFEEWRYAPQYGVDYFGQVFVKNPNRTIVLAMIAKQIRSVDKVKTVTNLKLTINNSTREATLSFTVTTIDKETFDYELEVWNYVNRRTKILYTEERGNLIGYPDMGTGRAKFYLDDGDLNVEMDQDMQELVRYELQDGQLIGTMLDQEET